MWNGQVGVHGLQTLCDLTPDFLRRVEHAGRDFLGGGICRRDP